MEKTTDALIRKLLKGWANQHQPPQNGRARLLWEASQRSRAKNQISLSRSDQRDLELYSGVQSNEWTHTLFHWVMENTVHNGIPARVC